MFRVSSESIGKNQSAKRAGLSILDLLITISIIGILIGLLVPAVQSARAAARKTQCMNNLKQIGLGLHNYHDQHRVFPPGALIKNELGWHVFLLPHIDQSALYNQFNFKPGKYYSSEVNHKNNPYGLTRIATYLCPASDQEFSLTSVDAVDGQKTYTTHYYGIMGPRGEDPTGKPYRKVEGFGPFSDHGVLGFETARGIKDITDGTSNTFIVGEVSWRDANVYRTWVRGVNGNPIGSCKNVMYPIHSKFFNGASGFNDVSLGSEHPGGALVLMGDGSARFLSEIIDLVTYKSAASIDGGETILDLF